MLWSNDHISNIWKKWNNNSFMQLLLINQMSEDNIIIEFGINVNCIEYKVFIEELGKLIRNKIPNGSLSFISYLSQNISDQNISVINTQFRKYRMEFIDSFQKYSNKDIKEKSIIFYNNLINLLMSYEKKG